MNDIPDDLIGTSEAAEMLRCTRMAIRNYVHGGRLRGWRTSQYGPILVSRAEVLALLVPVGRLPPPTGERERAYQRGLAACRAAGVKI